MPRSPACSCSRPSRVGIHEEDDDTGVVHIGHPDTGWQDVRFDIPEADVRAHGLASGSRVYVSMPLGQDTRVRIDTDGTVETLLTTPLLINGATEQDGVLTVSVFTTDVQTSTDEGLTWSEVNGPVLTGRTSYHGPVPRRRVRSGAATRPARHRRGAAGVAHHRCHRRPRGGRGRARGS